jgi:hypothetical protein
VQTSETEVTRLTNGSGSKQRKFCLFLVRSVVVFKTAFKKKVFKRLKRTKEGASYLAWFYLKQTAFV